MPVGIGFHTDTKIDKQLKIEFAIPVKSRFEMFRVARVICTISEIYW